MKQLTLHIPENLNMDETTIKSFLAAKLYETGKLSLGQAAELAGLSKTEFAETQADHDVSLINYFSSDIERDAAQF